jgi:hypothetical protein
LGAQTIQHTIVNSLFAFSNGSTARRHSPLPTSLKDTSRHSCANFNLSVYALERQNAPALRG